MFVRGCCTEEADEDGYVGRVVWAWGKEPICGLRVGLASDWRIVRPSGVNSTRWYSHRSSRRAMRNALVLTIINTVLAYKSPTRVVRQPWQAVFSAGTTTIPMTGRM